MAHQRNTTGLRRSAQERHQAALIRTETALQMMEQKGHVINFRTVAAAAHVSTAWLYQQPALRARIEAARMMPPSQPAKPGRQPATATQTAMITALRQRIRQLEDENRRLKHQLEVVYGYVYAGRRPGEEIHQDETMVREPNNPPG